MAIWMDEIQNLISKLSNPNHEIRKKAAINLAKIKSIRAVPALLNQIHKERFYFKNNIYECDVSQNYFDAIKKIGPQSIQYLISELIDCPDVTFNKLIKIIKSFDVKGYLKLREILLDNYFNCKDIIIILSFLKEKRAFKEVIPLLHHTSLEIVKSSLVYFLQFGDEGLKVIQEEFGNLQFKFEQQYNIDESWVNFLSELKIYFEKSQ